MKPVLIDSAIGRTLWKGVLSGLAGKEDSGFRVLGNDKVEVDGTVVPTHLLSEALHLGCKSRPSLKDKVIAPPGTRDRSFFAALISNSEVSDTL